MHKEYTAWAYERGVELRGISAHRFPGRGLGIRADRMIEVRSRFRYCLLFLLNASFDVLYFDIFD